MDGEITCDFSDIENYEVRGDLIPIKTKLASAISEDEIDIEIQSVLEKRDAEIIWYFTKELINHHFSDEENSPHFQKFNRLKHVVEVWYRDKLFLNNIADERFKKLIYFDDAKKVVDHIARGINTQKNTAEHIRPVFNYYNKFSSTKYVNGNTVKDVYYTEKSHVNCVVMDSNWEGICAKTFEELDSVICYVKNQFLGFTIPYVKDGKDHFYYPDFIARVKGKDGIVKNLMIEISGMSKDKAEKKWFVEKRWIPAVNSLKDKYEYPEWHFIEVANDIRNIKNQLIGKIQSI